MVYVFSKFVRARGIPGPSLRGNVVVDPQVATLSEIERALEDL